MPPCYKEEKERERWLCDLKARYSKAYDRVGWCFVEKMTSKMGFHSHWVAIIIDCISTPKTMEKHKGSLVLSAAFDKVIRYRLTYSLSVLKVYQLLSTELMSRKGSQVSLSLLIARVF